MINPYEDIDFKSCVFLFSKIRRDLASYDAANLIDEGEFPQYVMDILKTLGISVFKEEDAVIRIKDYKGKLPDNFSILHAAYKCTPSFDHKTVRHEQGSPINVYQDITWEILQRNTDCEIECCTRDKILEHVQIRQFVETKPFTMSLLNPILLTLSPNVKRDRCSSDCENIFATSPYEITISDREIYTNFTSDCIFLKYYGIPVDEDKVPLIPSIEFVEKTIEWYIKYQVLMNLWMNNQVPDLQNRWQYAEGQYNIFLQKARYERKMPSFARVVNNIRRKRNSGLLHIMAQSDYRGSWQKF